MPAASDAVYTARPSRSCHIFRRFKVTLLHLLVTFLTLGPAGGSTTPNGKPGLTDLTLVNSTMNEQANVTIENQYFDLFTGRNIKPRSIRVQPRTKLYENEVNSVTTEDDKMSTNSKLSKKEFYEEKFPYEPSSTFLRSYFHYIVNYTHETHKPYGDYEMCDMIERSNIKEYFCKTVPKRLRETRTLKDAEDIFTEVSSVHHFKFCDMFPMFTAMDFSRCDLFDEDSCGQCLDKLEEQDDFACDVHLELAEIMNKSNCDPNPWEKWTCDGCTVSSQRYVYIRETTPLCSAITY